jgi:hypothetical protein
MESAIFDRLPPAFGTISRECVLEAWWEEASATCGAHVAQGRSDMTW